MKIKNQSFIDHGIAAKAEEQRSSVLCRGGDGNDYFVICSRGFVISLNLNTRAYQQVFFPEGHIDFPYGSIGSSKGFVYIGAGSMFMEFDPSAGCFTYYSYPMKSGELAGFGYAEDREGNIYFGSYPYCRLLRYDPGKKTIADLGRMDETEMYIRGIAIDDREWIYLGIGTEKKGITAFHPDTGEKRQLMPEEQRTQGNGYVYRGKDGKVYGNTDQSGRDDVPWYLLEEGKLKEVKRSEVSPGFYYGVCYSFSVIHSLFLDGSVIKGYNLREGEVVYSEPATSEEVHVKLEYETEGAELSPIVAGPDGNIYGTTNHPFQFFSFSPEKNEITNWGGRVFQYGLANICAYARQGPVIAGAAYSGGFICVYDTSKAVVKGNSGVAGLKGPVLKSGNPSVVAIHEEIHRPRCALAHPDGRHVIFGGYAGYGAVGGALCIYDIETGEDVLIKNEDLLPYHSTLCMRALENGDLICGTSVEAPGGGHARVEAGELYRLDWRTRQVIYRIVPIPGAREISLMEIDENRRIHCITCDSLYFVFDLDKQEVLHKQDLYEYGDVVRDGMIMGSDGKIYGLLSKAIYRIDPDTFSVQRLAAPDFSITSGMAMMGGKLYFGSGSHLWSYQLQ